MTSRCAGCTPTRCHYIHVTLHIHNIAYTYIHVTLRTLHRMFKVSTRKAVHGSVTSLTFSILPLPNFILPNLAQPDQPPCNASCSYPLSLLAPPTRSLIVNFHLSVASCFAHPNLLSGVSPALRAASRHLQMPHRRTRPWVAWKEASQLPRKQPNVQMTSPKAQMTSKCQLMW